MRMGYHDQSRLRVRRGTITVKGRLREKGSEGEGEKEETREGRQTPEICTRGERAHVRGRATRVFPRLNRSPRSSPPQSTKQAALKPPPSPANPRKIRPCRPHRRRRRRASSSARCPSLRSVRRPPPTSPTTRPASRALPPRVCSGPRRNTRLRSPPSRAPALGSPPLASPRSLQLRRVEVRAGMARVRRPQARRGRVRRALY